MNTCKMTINVKVRRWVFWPAIFLQLPVFLASGKVWVPSFAIKVAS